MVPAQRIDPMVDRIKRCWLEWGSCDVIHRQQIHMTQQALTEVKERLKVFFPVICVFNEQVFKGNAAISLLHVVHEGGFEVREPLGANAWHELIMLRLNR